MDAALGGQGEAMERDRYLIEAVDRALEVLEILAQEPDLGVTELARRLGVSKTLAFRLLHTLERRDYIIRDPLRRTSQLGHRLRYLADRVEHQNILVRATKELLDEFARVCREDINLFVRTGMTALCVATRPSPHQVRMMAEVGRSNLLHVGGSSTVLLAFAPPEVQEIVLRGELKMFTPHTLVDPVRLRQRLEQVRALGYHVSRGDLDEAGFSIAAPIFGYGGVVMAAVSIAGALSRLTPELTDHYRDLALSFADRMSAAIGGRVPLVPDADSSPTAPA